MKKSLSTIMSFIWIIVFVFAFTACSNEVNTLDSLQNEYGIVIEGGDFEEGSILISDEIDVTTEEAATVLEAIANQGYKKRW